MRDTIRQMLADWAAATPAQRAEALRKSGEAARRTERTAIKTYHSNALGRVTIPE